MKQNITITIILIICLTTLIITSCQKINNQAETTQIKKDVPTPAPEIEVQEPAENISAKQEAPAPEPVQPQEPTVEEAPAPTTIHIVEITNEAFKPKTISINVGDKVIWKNVRTGSLSQAMIVGNSLCREVRSNQFSSGDSFEWTFNQTKECIITDGIRTTQTSTVTIN